MLNLQLVRCKLGGNMPNSSIESLQIDQQTLLEKLQGLGPCMQGSLIRRHVRCGNPSCHCSQEGDPGHGPHWYLSRSRKGKTMTKKIPQHQVEQVQQQVQRYHVFQDIMHELMETNNRICELMLKEQQAAEDTAAKKRGSRENSRRK